MSVKFESALFADDANVFIYANNLNQFYSGGNRALTEISHWLSANKLNLNISKTNYSLYAPRSQKRISANNLMFQNTEIQRSNVIKYLGLQIDEQLTWKDHLKNVYSNLIKYTGIFL